MKHTTRARYRVLAAVLAAATGLVAVGAANPSASAHGDTTPTTVDDQSSTTMAMDMTPGSTLPPNPTPSAADAAACASYQALSHEMNSGPNGPSDPSKIPALVDDVVTHAPTALKASLTTMTAAVTAVLASQGKDFSPFMRRDFTKAQSDVELWMFNTCAFDTRIEVTAANYKFVGLPAEIKAGHIGILVTNTATDSHELTLAGRKEGITDAWSDLLNLPMDQVQAKINFLGHASAWATGDHGLIDVTLTPGDYLAACALPLGTSASADGTVTEGTGAPHFAAGMSQEIKVVA